MEGHLPICMSAVGWGGTGYPQRDFLIRVASGETDSSEGPPESLPSPSTPSNPENTPFPPLGGELPGAWGPVGIQEVGWQAGQARFLGVGVTWPRRVSATR